MLKIVESKSNFDTIFEGIILTLSTIFIFLGFGGLIIVITTHRYRSDVLLEYAYAFVYSYMLALGIILLLYRKKILVKR
ncbi:MAG: hypothetical protein GTN40_04145 [Candidatus Aenigmarchaeota archaeon]|nr:hypothetical protein [Candidatus Aenigmarchaeota archaeon]